MKLDNLQAKVDQLTREQFFHPVPPQQDGKNKAMQALGRLGGRPRKALSIDPLTTRKPLKITNNDNKNRFVFKQALQKSG